jgi:hypothetical protein
VAVRDPHFSQQVPVLMRPNDLSAGSPMKLRPSCTDPSDASGAPSSN